MSTTAPDPMPAERRELACSWPSLAPALTAVRSVDPFARTSTITISCIWLQGADPLAPGVIGGGAWRSAGAPLRAQRQAAHRVALDASSAGNQARVTTAAGQWTRPGTVLASSKAARSSAAPCEMAFTTATDSESAGPATAVAEALAKPDEIEYPEQNWIAQSISHGDAVLQAAAALRNHFRDRPDVLVAMELAVYYRRDDNNARRQRSCRRPGADLSAQAAPGHGPARPGSAARSRGNR